MLKKLLKYDLKWIYKVILVFYALAIFFALLSFGLSKAENSTLLNVLAQISCGFTVAMVANCIVNSIMRSWVRFRNNMYKDESYLTHTLPVSRNTVFLSKTLSAFICTFISTAVSAACIVLCYYNNDVIKESVKTMLGSLADSFGVSKAAVLAFLVFIVFLEIMFILITGYTGMIIGHRSNKMKMAKSIIIGFAVYLAFNVLTVGIICLAGIFDDRIMKIITSSDSVTAYVLKFFLIIAVVVYSVYNLILYIIGSKCLEKGVNID